MCGIAGLLLNDRAARPDPARLHSMVEALTHRGPDDAGFHIDGPVAFGVRRLAIVDPAGGHQPITNEDRSIWVVYNGECYNFAELRAALHAAGHRFATRTDTEILVHGYEQWGIRGLAERLNGIYGFCLWDSRQRVAYLVRDRLGVKPLYYIERAPGLAFASELRSLIHSGLCLPKLDDEAIWGYLLYQFPPTDRTPLAGVLRLPAGHMLEWRAEEPARIHRYWDFPEGGAVTNVSFEAAADEIGALLEHTVEHQMIGDVPMGCFLSGGLDSSAVAALMQRHSRRPVRTYSIAFPGLPDYDETPYAESLARSIGAQHTTVPFDEPVLLDHLPEYLARIDEPVADAAMLPTYILSATAARDVKVVLTGEGADEVFGGYAYYRRFIAGAPAPSDERHFLDRPTEGFAPGLPWPEPGSPSPHSGFPYVVSPAFIWCMLDQDRRPSYATFLRTLQAIEERLLPRSAAHTPLQRALCIDTKIWLGHDLMPKLDKATMAHGLEGRVPMLDHRLVELAFNLPDSYKVGPNGGKLVLRRALRSIVPETILNRKKQGFGVPMDAWFRTSLLEFARAALLDSVLVDEALLTRQAMQAILAAHCERGAHLGRLVWSLVNLDAWWRRTRGEIVAALPEDGAIAIGSRAGPPTVDIVIPVHESLNLVRDCVRSIRDWTGRPFRAILVQDGGPASTDERLRDLIDGDPRFEIIRNDETRGYVQTCIRGMHLCTADYIVLLNSDTVVTPGWLEGLVACAESDPTIAAVNPLTNESGNTSVRLPPGLNILTMAERVRALSRRHYPDITTGVGMCMLIRRSAIELLGGFDPIFEGAYCEESDMCMRFTEAGLRVVAADDVFIYHKGMGSYTEAAKQALYERNRTIFDARWSVPYERDWTAYARHDPLQYMRDALLRGTLAASDDPGAVHAVEHGIDHLDTGRALAAIADGERARVGTTVLSSRARWSPDRDTLAQWTVAREGHPLVRFDERAIAYPTRAYMTALPAASSGTLRITILVASFPLCGGVISIVQLARALIRAGHDVKFVTESPELVPELLNLWAQPIVYRDRAHLLSAFPESDVVIATYWSTAHDYLRALRDRYRFVSVYFIQDYEAWFYDETDYERRRDVVRSYAAADHHIVKSRWLAGKLQEHGTASEIVPLGLDLGVFYPRAKESRRPRVISVAAPDPVQRRRGFLETVEIFRRLHESRPDVELIFFGSEADTMPAVPFPYTYASRIYDQNRVAALISSADVLVDASHWQGFGRPGIEAMACGTVPVLTNAGGVTEYARDGHNCLLTSPKDLAGFTAAVLRLLDDQALFERMRACGIATAGGFSHEIEADRHLALYRRWVAEDLASGALDEVHERSSARGVRLQPDLRRRARTTR